MASLHPRTSAPLQAVAAIPPPASPPPPSTASTASPPPPSTASTDQELVTALRNGERGIGVRLYQHLVPVVDATLFRVFGRRDTDHADLVQSVFEQLVMTIYKGRFEAKCSLASWASVIACHVALSTLRARRRRRAVINPNADADMEQTAVSTSSNPETQAGAQQQLETVRRHLADMDEDRAAALLLHAMGHSLQEIASLTHVSVAAAQSRLSRGRRELQARLQSASLINNEAGQQGRAP